MSNFVMKWSSHKEGSPHALLCPVWKPKDKHTVSVETCLMENKKFGVYYTNL